MQGTLHAFDVPAITLRFIPARAGNTLRPQRQLPLPSAHPRSRGEHLSRRVVADSPPGSSPLARGTLAFIVIMPFLVRLIPARAGNTSLQRPTEKEATAHPRSRGEHAIGLGSHSALDGSSPLARGALFLDHQEPPSCRLIPARAGNTDGTPKYFTAETAHPRSRGEHLSSSWKKP